MAAGGLFLGESVDPATHTKTGERVELDPGSLTTHGLVVGMTGSGKTGLGVVLIEELLLAGVPVLAIDPKGDLPNLALTFPELRPEDFAPWVEPGTDPAAVATTWRDGLAGWGLGPERITALRQAASVTAYTPGSTAGVPLGIVGALRRPADGVDAETVTDEVDGFVSGLLGLVGIDADPLASPEHILLANLVHHAWESGEDLDLAGLVGRVQRPPIRKLGVLELDAVFPPDDRQKLAVRLNGLLASPAFAAWSAGDPLDIDRLLRPEGPDGRPGCAVVTLSHLSDEERQFAVSTILGKLVTWMRRQAGTDRLRALLWFDEVLGFVPPNGAPPAKRPLLTLLKQARAVGLGVVLATQNPVDVDYKGIANAGTWAIGRLQTEQDKARLLEGMTSAAGAVDIGTVGETVSGLAKREFVLRRPGAETPTTFTSRWAMSYLRGPMTREQLARLHPDTPGAPAVAAGGTAESGGPATEPTAPAPAPASPVAPAPTAAVALADDETSVAPAVADGWPVRWLDPAAPWAASAGAQPTSTRFAPGLALRLSLNYDDDKADLRHTEEWEAVVHPLAEPLDPASIHAVDHDDRDLLDAPPDGARYVLGAFAVDTKKALDGVRKAVVDHVARTRTLDVPVNRALKLYGRPGEDEAAFRLRCAAAADDAADAAAAKLRDTYGARIKRAEDQVAAASDRLQTTEESAKSKRTSELVDGAGSLLGALLGGRRRASSLARAAAGAVGRRRKAEEAGTRVEAARNRLEEKQAAVDDLEADLADDLAELAAEWDAKAAEVEVLQVALEKTDVQVTAACLLWVPVPAPAP